MRSKIYDMYLDEVDKSASNPEEPASYGMAIKLTAQQAAYLTQITIGIIIAFCCCNPECLWFGDNSMWLEHMDGSHYKCPWCLWKYVPWSDTKGGQSGSRRLSASATPPTTSGR